MITVFNTRQLATATGKASGALCGGWLFLLESHRGVGWAYWVAVSVLGAALLLLGARRDTGERRLVADRFEAGVSG